MASLTTTIEVTHAVSVDGLWPCGAKKADAADPKKMCAQVSALFDAIAAGCTPASFTIQEGGTAEAQATGTLTISGGSGAVGGTINGVAITHAWTTSDANSAALVAADINASANALIAGIVTASAASNVVTVRSVDATKTANAITLAASGTGVTASGARLTGGAGHDVAGVTYSAL